jgi:hypothetical protein
MNTLELETEMEKQLTRHDCQDCFAVRGQSMIDLIHPNTGKSVCFAETLDQIRLRYPTAERMTVADFCRSKAELQDAPVTWVTTTEETWHDMLEVLPPACYRQFDGGCGFLVGEPADHHAVNGFPRYDAFRRDVNGYWTASRPMTRYEFLTAIQTPITEAA